jgi:hypothetical protein
VPRNPIWDQWGDEAEGEEVIYSKHNERQARARGSKAVVRNEMLPILAAFLGTSRTNAHKNRKPLSVIAAARSVRLHRRPAPHITQIAPNK